MKPSYFVYFRELVQYWGWSNALRVLVYRYWPFCPSRVSFNWKGFAFPVSFRTGASSDFPAFRQTILKREFSPLEDLAPATIVDCGANAGYVSLWMLNTFPQARLIAVEPDPRNAAICRENLRPYGARATVVEAALWPVHTELRLLTGSREWGTQVEVAMHGGEIKTVTMQDLVRMAGGRIDLLKIDIEGSETALFSDPGVDSWISSVHNLTIECHGPECEAAVAGALRCYRFEHLQSGELDIYRLDHRPNQQRTLAHFALDRSDG